MPEHTPGPWEVVKCACGGLHCRIFGVDPPGRFPLGAGFLEADAHLVAAAPDLLAAVEMALFYECGKECNECDQSGLPLCRRAGSLASMLRTARDKARRGDA